jgi:hypothetical protein
LAVWLVATVVVQAMVGVLVKVGKTNSQNSQGLEIKFLKGFKNE